MHDSGASRREVANAYLELEHRHCERSEAIHSFFMWLYGLLRFARNDGSTIGSLKIEAGLCTDMMISQRSKIIPSYPVMTAPRCRSCRPLGLSASCRQIRTLSSAAKAIRAGDAHHEAMADRR